MRKVYAPVVIKGEGVDGQVLQEEVPCTADRCLEVFGWFETGSHRDLHSTTVLLSHMPQLGKFDRSIDNRQSFKHAVFKIYLTEYSMHLYCSITIQ